MKPIAIKMKIVAVIKSKNFWKIRILFTSVRRNRRKEEKEKPKKKRRSKIMKRSFQTTKEKKRVI